VKTSWGIAIMSTGRHSFKHNDARRLIRAVESAGKKVKGVTLSGNTITVLLEGDGGGGFGAADNEVENWLSKQQGHHENQR